MAGEKVVVDGEIVDADDVDVVDDGTVTVVDDLSDSDSEDEGAEGEEGEEEEAKSTTKEPWMTDEDEQPPSKVPVSTHIKMKQKLKGRISEKNEELERLKQEVERLKAGAIVPSTGAPMKTPKRPQENDFDTITEYNEALSKYDQAMIDIRLEAANRNRMAQEATLQVKAQLEKAVDEHYTRAAELIQENGIDTEVYQAADLAVRDAIETLMPGRGDITTDQIISVLGDGSEKVIFYLGRNKNALNELKSLLVEDSTGLKASLFLGQQRERLVNLKQRTSKAPAPGTPVKGDASPTSVKASSLLKRRKAAQKAGNIQLAYDIKKQAKAAGVDVSRW